MAETPLGDAEVSKAPAAAPQASASTTDARIATVVEFARAQAGKPYKFFSAGPDTYDCSGLTKAAYAQVGISLIHHSASQARQGFAVDPTTEPIQPGDLVFLTRRGAENINHVGIAIDADTWIHATGTGDVVRVGSMPSTGSITAVRRYVSS